MSKIKLNDDYYIAIVPCNYILYRRITKKKKTDTQNIKSKMFRPIGYYGDFEQLVKGLINAEINFSNAETLNDLIVKLTIFKDSILSSLQDIFLVGWRSIEEYDKGKYDWVLVKYFDKDYECVPCVAEKRADGKWYNRNDELIEFEIKYFFDMQQLDNLNNEVLK